MERVSRFLEGQSEPVSRNAVDKAGLGKAETVRQALDFLILDEFVSQTDGPRGAHLVSLIRAFREDDFVPSSSRQLVPDFVPDERLSYAESDFVPTSSPLRPSSSSHFVPPLTGDEVDGTRSNEVDRDEVVGGFDDIPF